MVKINYLKDEPYILAALGVKISQSPFEKTLEELYIECRENKEKSKKLVNSIIKNHNHNILLDFSPCAVTVDKLSRFAALYLWRNINTLNLIKGAGIEASLRVIKPTKYNEVVRDLGKQSFNLYEKALDEGIPVQDARFMIPEGALTRIIFSISPRYLLKLANVLKNSPLEELKEIGGGFARIAKESGYDVKITETPATVWDIWNKESVEDKDKFSLNYSGKPETLALEYDIRGSLSMYAQLVRDRQFLCNIEPLERISKKAGFVVPNSFSSNIKEEYIKLAKTAKEKQLELIEKRDPNFVYFLLLGQEAKCNLNSAGVGVIDTSKKRCCGVTQWEIRSNVAVPIAKELAKYSELRNEIGPRCWRKDICIEPPTFKTKNNKCKVFERYKGKRADNLENLLELFNNPAQTVRV